MSNVKTTGLLISSSTELKLIGAISEYYCGATITLHGDTWPKAVHNSKGVINGVEARQVCKSGRVRFQLCEKD